MGGGWKDWERLGMTENDWEGLGRTGRRANGTTRLRDDGTTGQRDHETTGRRDCETAGRRDDETTGLRDNGTARQRDHETTRKHRHSQAFSGILSCAWQCVAAWCQSGVDVVHRKRKHHGIVLKRTARGALLFGMCRRCATITPSYRVKKNSVAETM